MSEKPVVGRLEMEKGLVTSDDPTKLATGCLVWPSQNFRIEELGSIIARDGYQQVGTIPAGYTVIGVATYDGKDGTRAIVISNGLSVQVLTTTGWQVVGSFSATGDVFRAVMHDGALICVNGVSNTMQLRWTGAAWEWREVGLDQPGDPSAVPGAVAPTTLNDPTIGNAFYSTFHPTFPAGPPAGSVIVTGHNNANLAYYALGAFSGQGAGTWRTSSAPKPRTVTDARQVLQAMPTGRVLYAPGCYVFPQSVDGTISRETYFWDPTANAPNGAWSANKPLDNPNIFHWGGASSTCVSPTGWANQVFAFIFFTGQTTQGWSVGRISETATTTNVEANIQVTSFNHDLNGGSTGYERYQQFRASQLVAVNQQNIVYLFCHDALNANTQTRVFKCNFTNNTVSGPFTTSDFVLDPDDRAVYTGGDHILIYREGTATVYRFNVNTDAWDSSVTDGSSHFRGMVPGTPNNALLYYFTTSATTNFESKVIVGAAAGGGGGGGRTFRVAVTFMDNVGRESNASAEVTITNVPNGTQTNLNLPVSSSPFVSARRIYSSLANDATGPLYLMDSETVNNNTDTTTTVLLDDASVLRTVTAPTTNDKPLGGARFVTSYANRLCLAAFQSDLAQAGFSDVDNSHAFPLLQRQTYKDRGRIMGLLRGNGFLVLPMSSTTIVYPGDPVGDNPVSRLVDYGSDDEEIAFEVDGKVGWLTEKGIIMFDGFNASRIDAAVSDLVDDELRPALRKRTASFRRLIRFSYAAPADTNRTAHLVYDAERNRWLYDDYPTPFRAYTINYQDLNLGVTPGSSSNVTVARTTADVNDYENLLTVATTVTAGAGTNLITLDNPFPLTARTGTVLEFVQNPGVWYGVSNLNSLTNQVTLTSNSPAGPLTLNNWRGNVVTAGTLTLSSATTIGGGPSMVETTWPFNSDAEMIGYQERRQQAGIAVTEITSPQGRRFNFNFNGSNVEAGNFLQFSSSPVWRQISTVNFNVITFTAAFPNADAPVGSTIVSIRPLNIRNGMLGFGDSHGPSSNFAYADLAPKNVWANVGPLTRVYSVGAPVNSNVWAAFSFVAGGGYFYWTGAAWAANNGTTATANTRAQYEGYGAAVWNAAGGFDVNNPHLSVRLFIEDTSLGADEGVPDVTIEWGAGNSTVIPTGRAYRSAFTPVTTYPNFLSFPASSLTVAGLTEPANTTARFGVQFSVAGNPRYFNGAAWVDITDLDTHPMTAAAITALTDAQWQATGGWTVGNSYRELHVYERSNDVSVRPIITGYSDLYTSGTAPTPVTIFEGLVGLNATQVHAMDRGSTDAGTAITALVTPIVFDGQQAYREMNFDHIGVDTSGSAPYTMSMTTRLDDGTPRTLQPIVVSAGAKPRNEQRRRFPMDHVARLLRTTLGVPWGVRLNKVFVGMRPRGRRP